MPVRQTCAAQQQRQQQQHTDIHSDQQDPDHPRSRLDEGRQGKERLCHGRVDGGYFLVGNVREEFSAQRDQLGSRRRVSKRGDPVSGQIPVPGIPGHVQGEVRRMQEPDHEAKGDAGGQQENPPTPSPPAEPSRHSQHVESGESEKEGHEGAGPDTP